MRLIYITLGCVIALIITLMTTGSEKPEQTTNTKTLVQTNKNETLALTVYKDKNCGCCKKWVTHLNEHDIKTHVINLDNMAQIKDKYQIQSNHRSCHTAISSDGFVFEGHVPAKFIKQFLAEKNHSQALGLAVPAMPVGSPGMEVDTQFMRYNILQMNKNSTAEQYEAVTHYDQQF
ncbi:MAG: DUF411 domain-containing protein [Thalassotalea sp.]